MAVRTSGQLDLTSAGPSCERAVRLPGPWGDLFGIFSCPPQGAQKAVIVLPGGGVPSTNHGQTWVRAARALVERGVAVLRLDYHGVGESPGDIGVIRICEPFVEDVLAAVDFVQAQGIGRLILVGTCFGGHSTLGALRTIRADEVLLFDVPLCEGTFGEDLQRDRPTLEALRTIERCLQSGTCVELVYGAPDESLETLQEPAVAGELARLGERFGPRLKVRVLPVAIHSLPSLDAQAVVVQRIVDFCLPSEG